jgi:hypothetical protein
LTGVDCVARDVHCPPFLDESAIQQPSHAHVVLDDQQLHQDASDVEAICSDTSEVSKL